MTTSAIYDIPLQRLNGTPATLGEYKGKVLLIVNVASMCGLTPQYEALEALYEAQSAKGLEVLGFPCNDFLGQEPGTAEEIQSFCTANFGVKFPMFEKVNINSSPRHPLYAALIAAQPKADAANGTAFRERLGSKNLLPANDSDVMWNFEKFLVGRDGTVVARFSPDVTPDHPALQAAIEKALG